MLRKIAAAVAIASLTACASVPMGTPSQDAALKKFEPVEGKAAVYIYRNEMFAYGVRMDVLVNGEDIGTTAALSYIYTTLPPGQHKISSKAEDNTSIRLNAEAGKVYYVWQEAVSGSWYARSKLHLVDEKTGQAGVRECGLVAALAE